MKTVTEQEKRRQTAREIKAELRKREPRTDEHEKYMKMAIKQAERAKKLGEVPIGCIIVKDGEIVGRGYNRRNTDKSTLSHAEITAIRRASKKLGDWRLEGCTLYVTLEPCQMCAGAIVQARISEVVIGCMSPKSGCAGSVINLLQMEEFNHQVFIVKDILAGECSALLSAFFKEMRASRLCEIRINAAETKKNEKNIEKR